MAPSARRRRASVLLRRGQFQRSAHMLPALLRPAAAFGGASADKVALDSRRGRPIRQSSAARYWCEYRPTAPRQNDCAVASTICSTMKAAARHVRRSCDLSSLTSSAAHSRASGIFPASLKARAFAKAWLSADRSAADSFPDRAPRELRVAADVLRIGTDPKVSAGDKSRPSDLRSQRLSAPSQLAATWVPEGAGG